MSADDRQCGYVLRRGRRCRHTRTYWGSAELGWAQPNPQRCGRHLTDEQRAARELGDLSEFARWFPGLGLSPEPACWSWPVPAEATAMLRRWRDSSAAELGNIDRVTLFFDTLRLYDGGRCAICGQSGNPIEDHDHATGLVRGWLCRSCNVREGKNRGADTVFSRYRERHPYLILDIQEPYSGFGWENGAPIGGWPLGDDSNGMAGVM